MNNLPRLKTGMRGYYKLEAFKMDGSHRVVADWFPNLITNSGLNRLGSGGIIDRAFVGSGSAVPLVTDIAMGALVGTTISLQEIVTGNSGVAPYYAWARYRYRFAPGEGDGNLSEVGIGVPSALFSRALILDAEGDPTTITVLPDEYLDVIYELRMYPPTTDILMEAVIGGVTHDLIIRPCNVDDTAYWRLQNIHTTGSGGSMSTAAYATDIAAQESFPSGTSYNATSSTVQAYTDGSYQRRWNCTWSLGAGNIPTGIRSITFGHTQLGRWQVQFDPVIMKTSALNLMIPFTFHWARYP